jgi:cytoskeletal protein RodZ
MNIEKTHKARTAIIIIVAVLFVLGGGGLFYWYGLTQTRTNNVVEKFEEPPIVNTNRSTEANNSNSEVRSPEKSPEQYEGQNAAGDTSNANCIDAECSNFKIPEGEN